MLTIKLTWASARPRAMSRARTMARVMPTTRDKLRLRARAMVALGLGLGLGSLFMFKRPDHFCRRTKFNVTD